LKGKLKWLAALVCLIAVAGLGYDRYRVAYPKRILAIVDASYPMSTDWERIPDLLRALSPARYRVYALATDKGLIHSWRPDLRLGTIQPYAPRRLAELPNRLHLQETEQADEILLITNAPETELPEGLSWRIVRPAR
jgi:hypothetical protein